MGYLFAVLELPQDSIVVCFGSSFRVAAGRLDKWLKISLQQLIDFSIVIVIMPANTCTNQIKISYSYSK